MKKYLRVFFLSLIVSLLCACGSGIGGGNKTLDSDPRSFDDKMTLVPEDTLVIPVGSYSNIHSRYVKKCHINGSPYLGVVNEKTNDLELYSLEDPKDNFSIHYDEENGIMYRIAYRGIDYIGADGLRRNWDNKASSVIIMGEDFEKVGEVDLPMNTIYTRTYFTHNGKLYLSLNHPDNNPSEDRMVFVGFKSGKL